jgi:hypothetical protein
MLKQEDEEWEGQHSAMRVWLPCEGLDVVLDAVGVTKGLLQ